METRSFLNKSTSIIAGGKQVAIITEQDKAKLKEIVKAFAKIYGNVDVRPEIKE